LRELLETLVDLERAEVLLDAPRQRRARWMPHELERDEEFPDRFGQTRLACHDVGRRGEGHNGDVCRPHPENVFGQCRHEAVLFRRPTAIDVGRGVQDTGDTEPGLLIETNHDRVPMRTLALHQSRFGGAAEGKIENSSGIASPGDFFDDPNMTSAARSSKKRPSGKRQRIRHSEKTSES
jgi:hypothetical protein